MSYMMYGDRNLQSFPSALGNNCERTCGGFLVYVGKTPEGKRQWKCGTCNRTEER